MHFQHLLLLWETVYVGRFSDCLISFGHVWSSCGYLTHLAFPGKPQVDCWKRIMISTVHSDPKCPCTIMYPNFLHVFEISWRGHTLKMKMLEHNPLPNGHDIVALLVQVLLRPLWELKPNRRWGFQANLLYTMVMGWNHPEHRLLILINMDLSILIPRKNQQEILISWKNKSTEYWF